MTAIVAVASRSDRPALVGDGVSFTAVGVLGIGVAFLLVAVLLVIATSLRRRVTPKAGTGAGALRVAAIALLLLAVAVVVLPRLAGDGPLEEELLEAPITPTEGDRPAEPGQVVSSPTAVGAGILALVLVAVVALLALRPGASRRRPLAEPATEGGDDPAADGRPPVVDPRGPPRAVVLAAYEHGRRLVVPVVGAQPTDGPLSLLRQTRRTAVAEPFDDLTRAYLPVRFGVVRADEPRRDAALAALARLERELLS